jgi:hypothetical protein
MKFELIQDCRMLNPEYTKATRGSVSRFIMVAAGKVIEGTEETLLLCVGGNPKMRPADDEANAALLKKLSSPARARELARLKIMNSLKDDMSAGESAYTSELYERHAAEIEDRVSQPMLLAATLLEATDVTLSETLRTPEAATQEELDAAIKAVQSLPNFEHTVTVTNTLKLLKE